jgi:hypothetical protein
LHVGYLAGGELSHEGVDHVECFINLCPRPNSVGFWTFNYGKMVISHMRLPKALELRDNGCKWEIKKRVGYLLYGCQTWREGTTRRWG